MHQCTLAHTRLGVQRWNATPSVDAAARTNPSQNEKCPDTARIGAQIEYFAM